MPVIPYNKGSKFMDQAVMLLVLMAAVFIILVVRLKMPVGLSLIATSVLLAVAAGQGIPLRFLVEGMFSYLDVALVLITAMIFMKIIEKNGLLGALARDLILRTGQFPLLFLTVITLIIMFPGMITGSCTASVLATGVLVAPVLALLEMPQHMVGAIITMASVYGMIAPPVNILVMIIGGRIDMPYVGFDWVLGVIIFPLAIVTTWYLGYKYARKADFAVIKEKLAAEATGGCWTLYLPLIVVIVLMIGPKAMPEIFPDPRLPLTFVVGSVIGAFVGRRFAVLDAAKEGVDEILPVVGILFGVGALIEIMTLTGVRGGIVINALSMPPYLLLLGIAVSMPLFGGISVYGGASVLGVPFALALLGQNQIITVSALSLIGGMGSIVPPVALTPVITAQILGEPNYLKLVRPCIVPAVAAIVIGVLIIVFAEKIAMVLL
jgi:TRAP-type C4-dicarboxylate transport system permease large subunit